MMVIGQREEILIEKNKRHIEEMKEDIKGWKNELEYAKNKCDSEYEAYCVAMINICENTIAQLNNFYCQHFS